MRRVASLLYTGAAVACVGVAVSLTLVYIHARLAGSGSGYTSFCNVNAEINCDAVLTSPFATVLGIPVAWLAVPVYALVAALLLASARADSAARARGPLRAAAYAVTASTAFVLYMAFVSFAVLGTACLMCMGLYVVTALLVVLVPRAATQLDSTVDDGSATLSVKSVLTTFAVASVAVAAVATATWPGTTRELVELDGAGVGALTLEQVRAADPEFYDWYLSQPVLEVPGKDRNVSGAADAAVVIVEFSDFECAFCRRSHRELEALLQRKGDLVRVVHRHFPLDKTCNHALDKAIHANACRAAEAAECAALQDRYSELSALMFEHQDRLTEANLPRLALRAGLEMASFERCMATRVALDRVRADVRTGLRLEISSTPTLFFNGRRISGTFESASGYDQAVLIETLLLESGRSKER